MQGQAGFLSRRRRWYRGLQAETSRGLGAEGKHEGKRRLPPEGEARGRPAPRPRPRAGALAGLWRLRPGRRGVTPCGREAPRTWRLKGLAEGGVPETGAGGGGIKKLQNGRGLKVPLKTTERGGKLLPAPAPRLFICVGFLPGAPGPALPTPDRYPGAAAPPRGRAGGGRGEEAGGEGGRPGAPGSGTCPLRRAPGRGRRPTPGCPCPEGSPAPPQTPGGERGSGGEGVLGSAAPPALTGLRSRPAPRRLPARPRLPATGRRRAAAPPHLGVVIQVPQIQAPHPVHAGEERGMHWRPHDIVDIVGIVFKGVERLVVL